MLFRSERGQTSVWLSGARVRDTSVTYPAVGNTLPKGGLIPHAIPGRTGMKARKGAVGGAGGLSACWWGNGLPRRRRGADLRG